jgi:hypothetical protein
VAARFRKLDLPLAERFLKMAIGSVAWGASIDSMVVRMLDERREGAGVENLKNKAENLVAFKALGCGSTFED